MARIARVVVPGTPHHIVQRCVRRMGVFFSDADRVEYLEQLSEQGQRLGGSEVAPLAVPSDMLANITGRRSFLLQDDDSLAELRRHARTGRPLGSEAFPVQLEQSTGRVLRPRKRGPKHGR